MLHMMLGVEGVRDSPNVHGVGSTVVYRVCEPVIE